MGKVVKVRLDVARQGYREALEAARANPTAEAWARLIVAGKELSVAQQPKSAVSRRSRRAAIPSIHDLEGTPGQEAPDQERFE